MDTDQVPGGAGCAPGAVAEGAGCVRVAVDDGQAAAVPPAGAASAGCAAAPASDDGTPKPTPPQTVREFERALRTLGFNRQQAASIARHGFGGATVAPEPDETEHLREALQLLAISIESTS